MTTLTREAILAMPAGPEMDALVAEMVMEWRFRTDFDYSPPVDFWDGPGVVREIALWRPSTDIAAAWEVVEKLRADGYCFNIDACEPKQAIEPLVGFMRDGHHINDHYQADRRDWRAFGPVPLAICRAALQTTLTP